MEVTTHDRTESIMRAVPATRSDDKLLCMIFMQKSGLALTDAQIAAFYAMDDLWTVRRDRQKIQAAGKYPPTPEVEEHRYQTFKKVRANIPVMSSVDEALSDLPLSELRKREYGTN